jgi:hypothetical protein
VPIQAAGAPDAGGDACDNDNDGDGLPDGVECSNAAGDCLQGDAPNGVSVVLLPQVPELYPGVAAPLGIVCVNADVDNDGTQEASAADLAAKLGIPAGDVLEHVIETRQGEPDSDGDGWLDGYECAAGSNPDDPASTPEVSNGLDDDKDRVSDEQLLAPAGGGGDGDNDGLFNILELDARTACVRVGVGGHLPHNVLNHCTVRARADIDGDTVVDLENDADDDGISGLLDRDSDGDTIPDAVEVGRERTMANQADTDGDGCSDGLEVTFPAPLSPPNHPIEALRHADANGDNAISVADIALVVLRFGENVPAGDYPGIRLDAASPNGVISIEDAFVVVGQFGLNCL